MLQSSVKLMLGQVLDMQILRCFMLRSCTPLNRLLHSKHFGGSCAEVLTSHQQLLNQQAQQPFRRCL